MREKAGRIFVIIALIVAWAFFLIFAGNEIKEIVHRLLTGIFVGLSIYRFAMWLFPLEEKRDD